jgi:hypothetical protein
LISSPYTNSREEEYERRGWKKIYKLYASEATSYIKIMPMRNKFN